MKKVEEGAVIVGIKEELEKLGIPKMLKGRIMEGINGEKIRLTKGKSVVEKVNEILSGGVLIYEEIRKEQKKLIKEVSDGVKYMAVLKEYLEKIQDKEDERIKCRIKSVGDDYRRVMVAELVNLYEEIIKVRGRISQEGYEEKVSEVEKKVTKVYIIGYILEVERRVTGVQKIKALKDEIGKGK